MKLKSFLVMTVLLAGCAQNSNPSLTEPTAESLNAQGESYHFGASGVHIDYEKARNFYFLAVQKGSAVAANHLGRMYTNGEGVEKSPAEAEKCYQKSVALDGSDLNKCRNRALKDNSFCGILELAQGGNPYTQYVAFQAYNKGVNQNGKVIVPPNPNLAFEYLKKSCAKGEKIACATLGDRRIKIS